MTDSGMAQRIGEDIVFHRKYWVFQRIGVTVLGLFVVSAAMGLTATGPYSERRSVSDGPQLRVRYDGITHYMDSRRLEIEAQGTQEIRVSRAYLDAVKIERIRPEPREVISGESVSRFVFDPPTEGRLVVTFHVQPEDRGWIEGEVSTPEGRQVKVRSFNFP